MRVLAILVGVVVLLAAFDAVAQSTLANSWPAGTQSSPRASRCGPSPSRKEPDEQPGSENHAAPGS